MTMPKRLQAELMVVSLRTPNAWLTRLAVYIIGNALLCEGPNR
ncbi:protein of unknown function [Petrocella atlantisensis]|uniref:Uncharacterized protein n=1 Tax=Petrocella atlantisensis TaxID=2173034 RepID=A0A3P7P192_9FIRM|nr:protein of unknown function [Petrocella atlantisensis]